MEIKLAATLLVSMYVISGMTKIFTFGTSEAERFAKALGNRVSLNASIFIVFVAGIVELVGSYLVVSGVWTRQKQLVGLGSMILAVFTLLATLIFYAFPFRYKPVLSNLTAFSALLLLPRVCALSRE